MTAVEAQMGLRPPGPAAPGLKSETLIATKLLVPMGPTQVVHRNRLHALLDSGLRRKVTLVVAPAGFGKTVLVSDWLSGSKTAAVGWVSLDASDDQPSRFWAYVLAAFAQAGVTVPADLDALIEKAGTVGPEQTLAPLLNALTAITFDVVLVMDDYHLITSAAIHRDLGYLIERQPPQLRLVLLSRINPPFSVSRWKVDGQLIELRARQLAFTRDEATDFLGGQGVVMTSALQDSLLARLDGWAAALRLIAMWMAGRTDQEQAIGEFTASDHTVADYLTNEVLAQIPTGVREFLLWTSILPRFSGPLCDAVTGAGDGEATLRDLYDRGLFVEAVDQGRHWFRYHQLFGELLGQELLRTAPHLIQELHRRAAGWLDANGFTGEAIDHGIRAADWALVRRLMLSETLSIGARYDSVVVERWLLDLPPTVLETSPFFLMLHGFVLASSGRLEQGRSALRRAQDLLAVPGPDGEFLELPAFVLIIEGGIGRLEGDLATATACAQGVTDALSRIPESALGRMARAAVDISLAGALFWEGQEAPAEALVIATRRSIEHSLMIRMQVNSMALHALIKAMAGRLREASNLANAALATARQTGFAGQYFTIAAQLAVAVVAVRRVDTHAATETATAIERAHRNADRGALVVAEVLASQLSMMDGSAAMAATPRFDTRWPDWELPAGLRAIVLAEEIRQCLLHNDPAAARDVLRRLMSVADPPPGVLAAQHLCTARIMLAESCDLDAAITLFQAAGDLAEAGDLVATAVEARIGGALASNQAGDLIGALDGLLRALALAEDDDLAMPFLLGGPAVRTLLLRLESAAGAFVTRTFRQRLLDLMGVPLALPTQRQASVVDPDALTARELTVLRMLRGNLSNTEIAATLDVSTNTLKTHLKHIYRKLEVTNRQAAVAKPAANS